MPTIILGQTKKHEEIELRLFETAIKNNGVHALPLGAAFQTADENLVFDKMINEGHLRLIDIRPMPLPGPVVQQQVVMARIFLLTKEGKARLQEIKSRKMIDGKAVTS